MSTGSSIPHDVYSRKELAFAVVCADRLYVNECFTSSNSSSGLRIRMTNPNRQSIRSVLHNTLAIAID